jgi:hypothetical protein
MRRATIVMLGLAVAGLGLSACGDTETASAAWPAEAGQYAVYATRIPLYPGTKVEDAMGAHTLGGDPDATRYRMTWWCTAKASRDELRAWYEGKLPGAARSVTEDGHVVLALAPEGAQPNEQMGVLIEADGKYRVFERTRQKKPGT